MELVANEINKFSRFYHDDNGTMVAIAFNEHGLGSNYTNNYFCLNGVWDQDANTSIVNADELEDIYQKCLTSSLY